MPKISKAGRKTPVEKTNTRDAARYTCTRCGRVFAKQRINFPASHSPLYAKNNGYLTVCGECVDEIYKQYTNELGSDVYGARRTCMKFDYYWDPVLYDATKRVAPDGASLIRSYTSKLNIYKTSFSKYGRGYARKLELERRGIRKYA